MTDEITILNNGMVKVDFFIAEGIYTYRDAIYLNQDIFNTWTQDDIEAEKQRRFQAYLDFVNSPPIEPTEADLNG